MSVFDITMIGIGAMIGAGIFVLTGEAAGVSGPALVLSFALNGVVTILTAMVYAELGSAIPEAGGGYLWIKEGLPGANAFLAGWMSWFAHGVAGALYCLGFGAFLFELLRQAAVPLAEIGISFTIGQKALGVLIAVTFAYINFRGSSETGLAGNIVTAVKMVVVLLFCLFGLKYMFFPDLWFTVGADPAGAGVGIARLSPLVPDETGWLGIVSAMGLTFIAFEGYEIIVQAGEEVVEPRKNIPRAVFWSLAIVVPTYMLVAFVLIGGTDPAFLLGSLQASGMPVPEGITAASANWQILGELGELGFAQAARQFVPYGTVLVLVGGVLSTMSALNATTFSSTRVSFAMGRDRNLPDAFSEVHPKTRTPHKALFWTAVLICSMVAFVPLTTVAAAADIMFLLLFLQVNIAVITLRKKYGDRLAYGYLMPFFPVVPILGIVTKLGLALIMFDHYPVAWLYVVAWLAVGFIVYRFYARDREREKERPPVVAEEKTLTPRPHSVLVAVADPDSAVMHLRLAARIARKRDSEVVLLRAEQVPVQLPRAAAMRFVDDARRILHDARDRMDDDAVPVSTVVRFAASAAQAVIYTVEEERSDFLLMGWRGDVRHTETRIGKNIDRVLEQSNSNAIILQRGEVKERERILVPVANPATAPLALAVAALLHEEGAPRIQVLHLSEQPLSEEEQEEFRDKLFGREEERGDGEDAGRKADEREGTGRDEGRRNVEDGGGGQGDAGKDEASEHPESLTPDPDLFELAFDTAADPGREIVRRSADFDRVVLGTSREGYFRRKVFGRLPLHIAEHARCPVVFVRPKEPGFKFGLQMFFQFFRDLEDGSNEGGKR